jgi:hypothetical protein
VSPLLPPLPPHPYFHFFTSSSSSFFFFFIVLFYFIYVLWAIFVFGGMIGISQVLSYKNGWKDYLTSQNVGSYLLELET